jgi:hypothetical protein
MLKELIHRAGELIRIPAFLDILCDSERSAALRVSFGGEFRLEAAFCVDVGFARAKWAVEIDGAEGAGA